MEPKKSEAIILRTKDFGESDLLVTFFSSLYGNLKGVAKGARRSSKRFVNSLNIFSLVNLEFRERRSGDLVWLDSCELIDGFPGIRSDYNLLLRASYMVEMTEILFPLNVPSSEMFQLLKFALSSISNRRNTEETMIMFQARAMKIGGFGINVSKCCLCGRPYKGEGRAVFHPPSGSIVCMACEKESVLIPGMKPDTVQVLAQLQSPDLSLSNTLPGDKDVLGELNRVLMAHIEHRLGKRFKSARYL
ncbi:MAG: DNA repair protein RecO [Desulfobacterales bacterium]|nr:DNA repair protein RecO [Desulfobacterales bacterium]